MKLIRSFIAIPLPESLCQKLATLQQNLREEMPELRTPSAQNLHLTLIFLGGQSEEQLAKISQFMLSVVDSQVAFSLNIQGLGSFPGRKRPRVVWLGVQPPESLLSLQGKLSSGLAKLGYPGEKTPYRPHLTLGRFRRPPTDTAILYHRQDLDFGPLKVESIVLYSSRLTPQGAVHQPLTVAELKGVVTY